MNIQKMERKKNKELLDSFYLKNIIKEMKNEHL